MENKFIKRGTKASVITASVIAGIALISLIMLITLLETSNKTNLAFFYTIALVFIITFWVGVLQIKIFTDHKSQRKYLCAEGIFIICLTVLIVITGIIFIALQAKYVFGAGLDGFDIRWFIGIFLLGYAIWKSCVVAIAIREKHKNWLLEIATAILWLAFSVLTIVSIFTKGNALEIVEWLFVAIGWLLIIVYIAYLLVSYIFNRPTYLETDEAKNILQKEIAMRNDRLARANAMMGSYSPGGDSVTPPEKPNNLELKLKQLKALLDKGILTKEEYEEKRKQIIKEYI